MTSRMNSVKIEPFTGDGRAMMADEVAGDKKSLDVSSEIQSVEGLETDEELLLARDVIGSHVKTIKAFRFILRGIRP